MSGQAAEQLTLFQGAFPVSPFPSQESEREKTTTAISGLKCCELSQSCGPLGLLEKTLLVSSLWSSRLVSLSWSARRLPLERVRTYEQYLPNESDTPLPESCKTLRVSDMPSGCLYFRLVASEPITGETESQLWRTPGAADCDGRGAYATYESYKKRLDSEQVSLSNQVKFPEMWPTPTVPNGGRSVKHVEDWRSGRTAYHNGKKVQVDLNAAVKMMPTPTSREYKGGRSPEALEAVGRNSTNSLSDFVQAGAQLNPNWVEWLMGFPSGWTDIDAGAEITPRDPHWWDIEPPIPRVAAGVAHRVGRLKCLGNAVVPAQFYPIFAAIAEIENNKL